MRLNRNISRIFPIGIFQIRTPARMQRNLQQTTRNRRNRRDSSRYRRIRSTERKRGEN